MEKDEFNNYLDQITDETGYDFDNIQKGFAFQAAKKYNNKFLLKIIENYSGENLMKFQKNFIKLYGSHEIVKEKANSFAVGFGKACELINKDLKKLKI